MRDRGVSHLLFQILAICGRRSNLGNDHRACPADAPFASAPGVWFTEWRAVVAIVVAGNFTELTSTYDVPTERGGGGDQKPQSNITVKQYFMRLRTGWVQVIIELIVDVVWICHHRNEWNEAELMGDSLPDSQRGWRLPTRGKGVQGWGISGPQVARML